MKLKKILAGIVAMALVATTMSVCAFAEDAPAEDTTVGVEAISAEEEMPADGETMADEAPVDGEETVAEETVAEKTETDDAVVTTEMALDETAADETVAEAGNTDAPTEDKNVNTGVEGIAVIGGVALLAAGALVISRKRK